MGYDRPSSNDKHNEGEKAEFSRPQVLEAEEFVGEAADDPAAIEEYYELGRRAPDLLRQFPGQVRRPEFFRQIQYSQVAVEDYCVTELGLDVSEYILGSPEQILVFESKAFDFMKQRIGKAEGVEGFSNSYGSLVCVRDEPDHLSSVLYHAQHELSHTIEYREVQLTRDETGTLQSTVLRQGYGLEGTGEFINFNEMVLEAFNQEVSTRLPPQFRLAEERIVAYPGFVTAFNEMIVPEIAEQTGDTEERIKKEFFKGRLTGDWTAIDKLRQTFGAEGLACIARMDRSPGDTNDAVVTMQQLGFTKAKWNR